MAVMTKKEIEEQVQAINKFIVKKCHDVLEKYEVVSVTCINTGKYEVVSYDGNTYTVQFVLFDDSDSYGTFECNCNTKIQNYRKCKHFGAVIVISGRVTVEFNFFE